METHIPTRTCSWMLTSTLLEITPCWKQHKCPSIRDWTNCGTFADGKLLGHKKESMTDTQKTWMPYLPRRRQIWKYKLYSSTFVSSRTGKASERWWKRTVVAHGGGDPVNVAEGRSVNQNSCIYALCILLYVNFALILRSSWLIFEAECNRRTAERLLE